METIKAHLKDTALPHDVLAHMALGWQSTASRGTRELMKCHWYVCEFS